MEMNTQRVTVCDNNGMISVSSPTTLKFAQPKCQYSLLDIDWNSLKSLSDRPVNEISLGDKRYRVFVFWCCR